MKKTLLLFSSLLLCITSVFASTSVSGGIYSNTTWTTAGSPYIITGTIVVFPGIILTIQPGVTVEFNNGIMMEIRQGQLIALGNASDSIIFKSSSSTPSPGIYSGIYLDGGTMSSRFSFCSFDYADTAISSTTTGSLTVKNSNFNYANNGINLVSSLDSLTILNSNFSHIVDVGVFSYYSGTLTIQNSNFNYNGNGVNCDNFTTSIISNCNFNYCTTTGLFLIYSNDPLAISSCNFSYNGTGLIIRENSHGGTATNCTFTNNQAGISANNTRFYNCYLAHNQMGIGYNYDLGYSGNSYNNSIIDSNTVTGILANSDSVLNCRIDYNGTGIQDINSFIEYDTIEYNTTADIDMSGDYENSVITENIIEYSPVGIDNVYSPAIITNNSISNNTIGIVLDSSSSTISCNNICNNSTYSIQYESSYNAIATNNYWCLPDSAAIRNTIYDGYTNISLGLIIITPFKTIPCDSLGIPTSINTLKTNNEAFQVYPNPANTVVFISMNQAIDGNITLTNVLGQDVYNAAISGNSGAIQKVDISNLQQGVYFLKITSNGQVLTKKVLKI